MLMTIMMMLLFIAWKVICIIIIMVLIWCDEDDDIGSTVLKSPRLQPRPSVRHTTLHDSASHLWYHRRRRRRRRTFDPSDRIVRKGRHDVGRRLLRPVHAIRYTEKEIRAVGFQIRVPELQLAQRDAVHVGDLAAVVAGLDRVVSDFYRFVNESTKEVSCSDRLKW
jgi:hypothetical protein